MSAPTTQRLQIFFDRIRSNKVFEMFVVGVILFSAVIIGIPQLRIRQPGSANHGGLRSGHYLVLFI